VSRPRTPEALYIEDGPDPVFVTIHRPSPETARDTAVILCPPFGWDDVSSYRMLREWAARLATAGYPAIRMSFPSSGDSGGDVRDSDRVGAWVAASVSTARWVQAEVRARRVVAIGMGLGGVLAYLGAAAGGPIDDFVLWGTPARGRALVRQIRAFSKLETARFFEGLELPAPLPAGELEAGGFLLSAETVAQLERIDLTEVELPNAESRRALLLERDGIAFDQQLRHHLEAAGTAVAMGPGRGYGAMTSHPQHARIPGGVIERVNGWLDEASAPSTAEHPPHPVAGAVSSAVVNLRDGGAVRETAVTIRQTFGVLSGVITEPLHQPRHGLCVVLLNAGAVRRVGPSRIWVEAARRWSADGVPSLRLDIEGIGDADGPANPYEEDAALYVPTLVPQVIRALDFLQARGVGDQFVLVGLCAGAYWAFHGALRDPRVCAAAMLNPRALIWKTGLGAARDMRSLLSEPISLSRLRRVATGPRRRVFLRWLFATPGRYLRRFGAPELAAAVTERDIDAALEELRRSGKRALFLFSEREPVYEELVRSGRLELIRSWPNVTLERVAVRDHTMRPNGAQKQVHAALDRALARELEWLATTPTAGAH
jgi:dienelactone hydrolase